MPKSNHKMWTDFKKKHPDFEKDAVVKQDLGPALDLWDRAFDRVEKGGAVKEMQRALEGGKVAERVIRAALDAYEQRFKAGMFDPKLRRDFENFQKLIEMQLGQFS